MSLCQLCKKLWLSLGIFVFSLSSFSTLHLCLFFSFIFICWIKGIKSIPQNRNITIFKTDICSWRFFRLRRSELLIRIFTSWTLMVCRIMFQVIMTEFHEYIFHICVYASYEFPYRCFFVVYTGLFQKVQQFAESWPPRTES